MIVVAEHHNANAAHAPGNATLCRVLAEAFPHRPLLFAAGREHLTAVRELFAADNPDSISFESFKPTGHGPATWDQVMQTRSAMLQILDRRGMDRPGLYVHAFASGPTMAASRLVRLNGTMRDLVVHQRLHALYDPLFGWRSRNPLLRAVDLRGGLAGWMRDDDRIIVLDEGIAKAFRDEVPRRASQIDALEEPVDPTELADRTDAPAHSPVTIATFGVQTQARGFPEFLDFARQFAGSHPGALRFVGVGRIHPSMADVDQDGLAEPLGQDRLPRADFLRRMRAVHYVCMPFQGDYYRWAASGVLVDAIANGVPVIGFRYPQLVGLERQFGAFGYLCNDLDEMRAVLRSIAEDFDAERYRAHLAVLARIRATRTVEHLAGVYRERIAQHHPRLFEKLAC